MLKILFLIFGKEALELVWEVYDFLCFDLWFALKFRYSENDTVLWYDYVDLSVVWKCGDFGSFVN